MMNRGMKVMIASPSTQEYLKEDPLIYEHTIQFKLLGKEFLFQLKVKDIN